MTNIMYSMTTEQRTDFSRFCSCQRNTSKLKYEFICL